MTETEFKYLKLTSEGVSVSDDTKPESFTSVLNVSRTNLIFNNLFTIFLGEESLDHFIIRRIEEIVARYFEVAKDTGTLKIKMKVQMMKDLEIEGQTKCMSEAYIGGN